ncbi:Arm DNA-binding domain-containing protein [Glaciimonas sp. PCH181]|uniref:Arm DNA-binding domain-containing protein n=1 Tax=Glaciimonas sp. PCH181 TaxID=2133943 RepID=UPI001CEDE89E
MSYRQERAKQNRLTFGAYPEVSPLEARAKRTAARKLLTDGIDTENSGVTQSRLRPSQQLHKNS